VSLDLEEALASFIQSGALALDASSIANLPRIGDYRVIEEKPFEKFVRSAMEYALDLRTIDSVISNNKEYQARNAFVIAN